MKRCQIAHRKLLEKLVNTFINKNRMETAQKFTTQDILNLVPSVVYLTYVDYRDSLDENHEAVQRCISEKTWEYIDEFSFDAFSEQDRDSIDGYKESMKNALIVKFGCTQEEADDAFEQDNDLIEDHIRNNDKSDIIHDLCRNSRQLTLFYDTCFEIPETVFMSKKQIVSIRTQIKKTLGIRSTIHDAKIYEIIKNATYGGRLVIYFNMGIEEIIQCVTDEVYNAIQFDGFNLAIIDNGNGSGFDGFINAKIKLPFNHKNLFICDTVNYSYTFEVCGMSYDWCKFTDAQFVISKEKFPLKDSSINEHIESEKEKDKTFKSGKCTPGDMNIKRHRDTYYTNEYPCGTRCPHCSTFWID
jgi:hypothetical protein